MAAARDGLLQFLSKDWAGLVPALLFCAIGVVLIIGGWAFPGAGVLVGGTALAIGSLIHIARRRRSAHRLPPPGRMIDLDGFRVHMLAEGPANGPAIVWFGGAHASGAAMRHLHDALKGTRRSILIDRPGAGWSDAGPFPRTTAREAEEMALALDRAGEGDRFILAGYSFGGLLVANIARRRPDLVAHLVLLDPTPLDTIVYGPRLGALGQQRREMLLTAVLRLFGWRGHLTLRRMAKHPAYAALNARAEAIGGQAHRDNREVEGGSRSDLASWSIFQELSPEGVAACGWKTVVYDRELQGMPVTLVAPGDASEVTSEPEIAGAGDETGRMIRFFAASRERYMGTSTRARRIVTPPGTTHQFVVETPEFVADVVRGIAAETPQ